MTRRVEKIRPGQGRLLPFGVSSAGGAGMPAPGDLWARHDDLNMIWQEQTEVWQRERRRWTEASWLL